MKEVFVRELRPGYILEEDIIIGGSTLAHKGKILTPTMVNRIKRLAFEHEKITISKEKCTKQKQEKVNMSNCLGETKEETVKALRGIFKPTSMSNQELKECVVAVDECAKQVKDKVAKLNQDQLTYEFDEYQKLGVSDKEEHSIRVTKLVVALAQIYNKQVAREQRISLTDISTATLLHDFGKRFAHDMEGFRKLQNNAEALKYLTKLNVKVNEIFKYPATYAEPYYAFVALYKILPWPVLNMILFSGLKFEQPTEEQLADPIVRKRIERQLADPVVRGAKLIAICDKFDDVLSVVLRDNMSLTLENVLAVIGQLAMNEDVSKKMYDLLINHLELYPLGTEVVLNCGKSAKVVGSNKGFPTRPIVWVEESKKVIDLCEVTTVTIDKIVTKSVLVKEQIDEIQGLQLASLRG